MNLAAQLSAATGVQLDAPAELNEFWGRLFGTWMPEPIQRDGYPPIPHRLHGPISGKNADERRTLRAERMALIVSILQHRQATSVNIAEWFGVCVETIVKDMRDMKDAGRITNVNTKNGMAAQWVAVA